LLPQDLGDDLGHVVEREILRTEQRNFFYSAPTLVEQQTRCRGSDVAGSDGRQLAVAVDGREEHPLVLDRLGLADDVVHERRVGERSIANTRAGDKVV